jgi:hypothetical protein
MSRNIIFVVRLIVYMLNHADFVVQNFQILSSFWVQVFCEQFTSAHLWRMFLTQSKSPACTYWKMNRLSYLGEGRNLLIYFFTFII